MPEIHEDNLGDDITIAERIALGEMRGRMPEVPKVCMAIKNLSVNQMTGGQVLSRLEGLTVDLPNLIPNQTVYSMGFHSLDDDIPEEGVVKYDIGNMSLFIRYSTLELLVNGGFLWRDNGGLIRGQTFTSNMYNVIDRQGTNFFAQQNMTELRTNSGTIIAKGLVSQEDVLTQFFHINILNAIR